MPITPQSQLQATARWRRRHPDKFQAQRRRRTLHKRWEREFARMGLVFEDFHGHERCCWASLPTRSHNAARMMLAYEHMTTAQEQQCKMCRELDDLIIPAFDVHGRLWGFVCERCARYVETTKGDEE